MAARAAKPLYVDLLAEAHAEARYITHASVTPEVREQAAGLFKASDVSTAVNLQVGELRDKLQDAVRHELGAGPDRAIAKPNRDTRRDTGAAESVCFPMPSR